MTSSALSVPRGLSQTLSSRNIGRRCNNSICAVSVKQQVVIAPPTFLADETGRNPLATRHEMPLLGKRVLITAPRQYAHKLSARLVNTGARVMWIPGIEIGALLEGSPELAAFDGALRQLMRKGHGFTHIAFTSKNGIYAVLQRLGELTGRGIPGAVQVLKESGTRLCTLGADEDVLLKAGLVPHVRPTEASTQGLVRELVARDEAAGARVLCPVPEVSGGLTEPPVVPRFLAALQAAGASHVRVPAYSTTPGCGPAECDAEAGMLRRGELHAIAFSSTAEAQGLAAAMGGAATLAAAVQQHGLVLAAHGPYTAAGVSQVLGVPVPVVSRNFASFDGLVAALEQHWGQCAKNN